MAKIVASRETSACRACGPPRAARRRRRGPSGRWSPRTRSWARATMASSTTATAAHAVARPLDGEPRLGERLAHEQLVVHARDDTGRWSALTPAAARRTPPGTCTGTAPLRGLRRRDRTPARSTLAHVRTRRIGILTGGGDVPGLNSVIKSVVYRADRDRLRGHRHPPRLGGPHPRGAEGRARPRLRHAARSDQHPDDRPDRRHLLHTSRTNPRKMRGSACPPWLAEPTRSSVPTGRGPLRPHPGRPREHRARSASTYLVTIGGDDTLSFAEVLDRARRDAGRDPQDDGQRRPGHRVLHRLLDGHHAGQGAHQPAADDARLPRADRRLPDLRRDAGFSALYTAYVTSAAASSRSSVRPRPPGRARSPRTTTTTRAGTPSSSPPRARSGRAATLAEYGEADAFGHRHKANVGEVLAAELQAPDGHRDGRLAS